MRKSKGRSLPEVRGRIIYLLAFVSCFASLSYSQIKSGTIVGTVLDPSGAVVPGANVTAVNQETNVPTTTVSDKSGGFTVPYLQAGLYTVNVETPGGNFAKFSATNISVATDQTVKITATLRMGSSVETVRVTAEAVELQTSTSAVQGLTNELTIDSIPNLTHNA